MTSVLMLLKHERSRLQHLKHITETDEDIVPMDRKRRIAALNRELEEYNLAILTLEKL